jgi:MFS family permease
LIRNTPEEYGEVPDGIVNKPTFDKSTGDDTFASSLERDYSIVEILKIPSFWIISICHACSTMLIGTMTVHLILALKDQGISVQVGALIWGSTMGFSGIAQIFGGWMGDKVPKNVALCVLGCVQSLGVVLATFLTTVYLAPIFVIVYGIGFGARIPLGTAIRGEYFGRKAFGKVLGLSMMPMSLLMTLGPLVAGKMYDLQGTYDYAFYMLSGIAIIGSLGFLFAKKPNNRTT